LTSPTLGGRVIRKYRNLGKALKIAFPEVPWVLGKFSMKQKRSTQRWYRRKEEGGGREEVKSTDLLFQVIQPDEEVIT
jgi:hypothetical protein